MVFSWKNGALFKKGIYESFPVTLRLIQESPTNNHKKTGALVVGVPITRLPKCNIKDVPWMTIK